MTTTFHREACRCLSCELSLTLPTRPTEAPKLAAQCLECGDWHEAEYSHEGRFGEGPIYAVVCTVDYLTSYYTGEIVHER